MNYDVVISTNNLNCYGTRILTSGLNTKQYKKNPVLLWMHDRHERMPIGRMENIRKEDDRLVGTLVFDEKDEFAASVKSKWDGGFIKMVSACVEPLEFSQDEKDLVPGQWRATITKSKLIEVSVVNIGGNDDALRLMKDGSLISLSDDEDNDAVPLLALSSAQSKKGANSINKQMDKILLCLGLASGSTEDDVVARITALKESAAKAEEMQLSLIASAIDLAIKEKRITADKKEHFVNLGNTMGLEQLNNTLSMFTPAQKPSEVIAGAGKGVKKVELAKWSDATEDELQLLLKEDKEKYIALFKAEFGFAPTV